jgi:hypothetical protein
VIREIREIRVLRDPRYTIRIARTRGARIVTPIRRFDPERALPDRAACTSV